MLRITQELEECIDAIYRLVKLNERSYKKGRSFSSEQTEAIREFAGSVQRFIEFTDKRLLSEVSDEDFKRAKSMKKTSTTVRKKFNKSAMKRMANGDMKSEMLNIDINNNFESVSNHALNIVQTGSSMHEG